MAPPAIFIAVQCCQCSTMQVKQQKKSRNKWTCVVCNQKQSIRKVYAQGFMAKDVRKFVQSFNMTRQLAHQNQLLLNSDQFETLEEEDRDSFPTNLKERRSDWAEYIDPPEEDSSYGFIPKISEDDEFDVKVVTEMPKPLFKKPKLNNYSVSSTGGKDYENTPTFSKRINKGQSSHKVACVNSSSIKCSTTKVNENCREMMSYAPGNQMEDMLVNKMGLKNRITEWKGDENCAKGASSKWSSYIDNEELLLGYGKEFTDRESEFEDDGVGSELMDQRVEEDIHPDFL